jgi:DNA polymerase-3 subunit alpha
VQNRYGRDRVAQIITFGKLQARAALRDVGRVLQMSFSQVDRLCKMVPNNPANPVTIAQAIADEPRLQEAAKEEFVVQQMLDIGQKIEGLYRHASTHAAGVVISDRPLHEITPLYLDPRSDMPATQFNMKWVEPAGLVKFDFLGLKTLTVIQNAIDMLTDRGVAIDINRIPLDDAKTFELYGRAETVAVFQVESAGMRDALRRLQPTAIEDIIALVALYRPGPMENIPKYCHVKHGREEPYYLHAILEPILKETQGIIVYQEQVMQIAQVMAGYSLGEADLLRRAMGKKIKEAMDLERPKFLSGAAQNGIDKAKAQEVWDLLEKFANYGFNKSHAAAYAFVSYQTAWLKANYPVEFMAAAMNLDMHNTEKLGIYRQELMRMKIPLLSPNINASEARFKPEKTADGVGAIRYALGALKNVGQDAMKAVARERDANGVFADIYDFAKRMDLKALGKRALENMVRSGVFDGLAHNRRQLMESLDTLIGVSSERIMAKATAQVSLFEGVGVAVEPPPLASVADWAPSDRLEQEAASIGFYISGHPLDDYSEALRRKRVLTFAELNGALGIGDAGARSAASISCRLSGVVSAKQERKSQKGTPFAFVQLSDPTGLYEIVVFSATLLESRALLEPGAKVVISVDAEREGDQVKLRAVGVQDIEQAVQGAESAGIAVHIGDPDAIISIRQSLEALCGEARPQPRDLGPPPRGFRTVEIVAAPTGENWEARLLLPDYYPIKTQARSALRAIPSVRDVEET